MTNFSQSLESIQIAWNFSLRKEAKKLAED